MSCEKCKKFPAPTSAFEEIGISIKRQGTLYECKYCGKYYEIVECRRTFNILDKKVAKLYYELAD